MARPPFNMLRACFYLLAIIMLVMMGETLLAVLGCLYLVLSSRTPVGACIEAGVATQVREAFSEALTAVLALLLAARNTPPPDE